MKTCMFVTPAGRAVSIAFLDASPQKKGRLAKENNASGRATQPLFYVERSCLQPAIDRFSNMGRDNSGGVSMICPICGSSHASVQFVPIKTKTTKKGVGPIGHMNNIARGLTAVSTLGMSNLLWKKSKGTERATVTSEKVGVCQNCGNSWMLERT